MKKNSINELAINGGKPVRQKPLPSRRVFGEFELDMVKRVFEDSWNSGIDFGYQGKFEEEFTGKFCEFQGGGFADAVSSGSSAVYLALKALDIKPGSDVIVSPVSSPGGIMPVALQDIKLIIPDSAPNSFNVSPEEFEKSITPKTRAAVLTHLGGHAIDLDPISEIAKSKGIKIVEDFSHAHGATYKGKKVGNFSDIAAASTMFSKTLSSGANGGIIYTRKEELYRKVRSLADRGKPFFEPNYNSKITTNYLYPALNHNSDELSCAMGICSLSRLQNTIDKRYEIAKKIDNGLKNFSVVQPANLELPNCKSSFFFHTVVVDITKLKVSKVQFANAIAAEGIAINSDFRDVTCEYKWIPKYVREYKKTPNSINFRDKSFNILFHEQFGDTEVEDIIRSIEKVEQFYAK